MKELRQTGTSYVWTSPITGREHGYPALPELLAAAGKTSYEGERLRACLPLVEVDLARERRRLEDNLRKDPAELCRVLGTWYRFT